MEKENIRPNYTRLKESIVSSIQGYYTEYKNSLRQYLDATWYGKDGQFCMRDGANKYIQESNTYLQRVSDGRRLLDLCNKVIEENNTSDELSDTETRFLKEMNFM